jgi:hypothetical protein
MGESRSLESLEEDLRTETYPLSSAEVRSRYGDVVLDLPGGEETVGDVLARVQAGPYPDAMALISSIEGGIGHEGVGRTDYSDRDTSTGEKTDESL